MARPIEYDIERNLDKIMETFWLKGYEGTTVSDLVEATELNTRTMYNLYGNKNGLFRAALGHYYNKVMSRFFETLKENEGMPGISRALFQVADFDMLNGCLFSNTLSDCNVVNWECLALVEDTFTRLEKRFATNLRQAKKAGEFAGDERTSSKLLLLILQGMSVFSRTGPSHAQRKKMVKSVLLMISAT